MALPPRLEPFLKQFTDARDRLITRLEGLTDDEYFWEPVTHCWSVRRREQSNATLPLGKGDWILEFDQVEPVPPPITTIAWRMCHLTNGLLYRADYTTGTHSLAWNEYEVSFNALAAIVSLTSATETWRNVLLNTTDANLDQVGHSQFPQGLDPRLPFIDIVWWVNQELLAHGAEIALLRDLYRAQNR